MNHAEVAALLTYAARFDKRTIGDSDVESWHDVLGDLPADWDAAAGAIRDWYREHREPVAPSDVRRGMRGSATDRHPAYRPLRESIAAADAAADATPMRALAAGPADPAAAEAARTRLAEAFDRVAAARALPPDVAAAPTGFDPRRRRLGDWRSRRRARQDTHDHRGRALTACHRCVCDILLPAGWDPTNPASPPLYCDACRRELAEERSEAS